MPCESGHHGPGGSRRRAGAAPHHEGWDLILRRREAPSRRMKPRCWKRP